MKTTMTMNELIKAGVVALSLMGTILVTTGRADASIYPASIAGTYQISITNNNDGSLVIQQPTTGSVCNDISGTLGGLPISGYYCPGQGTVVFGVQDSTHKYVALFRGNLNSGAGACQNANILIAGSKVNWDTGGEWQWQAVALHC